MLIDLSPLRFKNFRRLFIGQLIAAFGTQVTAVVIPFQVYTLTQSTFYTGLISAVEFFFIFCSSLMGGVLADRYNKRNILIAAELGLIITPLGLAYNATLPEPHLWLIFLLASCTSFLTGIHRPSLESLNPRLVPKEEVNKISALAPIRHILTTILSPMIGGVAMVTFGAVYTYLFDAVGLCISLLFLLSIDYKGITQEPAEKRSIFKEITEGFRYIRSRGEIFASYASDFIVMVLCNPMALFPALAASFKMESSIGVFYAIMPMGAMLMILTSRWTLTCTRYGIFIILAGALWSLSLTVVGLSPTFEWILFGLFCAGFFDAVSGVFRTTLWNETIPESIRGRIAGFEMVGYMSGPLLGNALLGFLADQIGIQTALLIGSLVSVFLVILFNLWIPALWKFKKNYGNLSVP